MRIAVVTLLALALGCPRHPPHGRDHAMWCESLYLRGDHPTRRELRPGFSDVPMPLQLTDEMVIAFAHKLRDHGIRYAYLFAGPFDRDGRLPDYAFSARAQRSVAIIKHEAPRVVILPWIGGLEHKQVCVEDAAWRQNAVASVARLMRTLDVPGVHVDLEYVLFGRAPDASIAYARNVNRFFAELRASQPRAFLSAVVPSTAPDVRPWKLRHSVAEVAELAPLVDQLSLLFYDTHLDDRERFRSNLEAQLEDIRAWRKLAPSTQFLVGVGTFVNREPALRAYRDLRVEGLAPYFATLDRAIADVPEGAPDGLAFYCEWETDAGEWEMIRRWTR
jgi:hypothetical protein